MDMATRIRYVCIQCIQKHGEEVAEKLNKDRADPHLDMHQEYKQSEPKEISLTGQRRKVAVSAI